MSSGRCASCCRFHKGLRPAWLLRLGLFLYDHIGGRKLLPATRTLDLARDPAGKPLKDRPFSPKAFEYSDCWVDDARLVALNARDAADRGADHPCRAPRSSAGREDGLWQSRRDRDGGARRPSGRRRWSTPPAPGSTRCWRPRRATTCQCALVQGSHIVVRKLYEHDRALHLPEPDGRIIFAIPYEAISR
jgi:glycerol-3-phosphate dehydrogenase